MYYPTFIQFYHRYITVKHVTVWPVHVSRGNCHKNERKINYQNVSSIYRVRIIKRREGSYLSFYTKKCQYKKYILFLSIQILMSRKMCVLFV